MSAESLRRSDSSETLHPSRHPVARSHVDGLLDRLYSRFHFVAALKEHRDARKSIIGDGLLDPLHDDVSFLPKRAGHLILGVCS